MHQRREQENADNDFDVFVHKISDARALVAAPLLAITLFPRTSERSVNREMSQTRTLAEC